MNQRNWHQYEPIAIHGIAYSGILTRNEARDLYATIVDDYRHGGKFAELYLHHELMDEIEGQR